MLADRSTVTIVVTVRERFSHSRACLEALYDNTPGPINLVYVAGGAPSDVRGWLSEQAAVRGFCLVIKNCYLTPNESRNMGLSYVNTEYVVFVENDVIPSANWLERMTACAIESGAEVIAPLICEGPPLHTTVHQAGGTFAIDPEAFFSTPPGRRQIKDSHTAQGQPVSTISPERRRVQTGEFHCIMVKTAFLRQLGGFDEKLLATREHLDFAMTVYKAGGTIILEPTALLTFMAPWIGKPLMLSDIPFHLVRWSPQWGERTVSWFQKKWGLDSAQRHDSFLSWRYGSDIVKPLIARVPMLGRSRLIKSAVSRLCVPVLRQVGRHAAVRADHQRLQQGMRMLAATRKQRPVRGLLASSSLPLLMSNGKRRQAT